MSDQRDEQAVAWMCQLVPNGEPYFLTTHPDLANNSPWETIIPLYPESLVATLRAEVADYEEVLADKRFMTRELDIALHGEEGAAQQASLCDLIQPAKKLRERATAAEAALAARPAEEGLVVERIDEYVNRFAENIPREERDEFYQIRDMAKREAMGKWMPIDTFDKPDKHAVLIWNASGQGAWSAYKSDGVWCDLYTARPHRLKPSHWQPMLDAPAALGRQA